MALKVVLLIKLQKYCTYKRLSIKNLVLLVPVTNVPCNCDGILVTGTGSTKGGQLSIKLEHDIIAHFMKIMWLKFDEYIIEWFF